MEELIMTYEDKMEKSLDNLYGEYTSIRAGRANPHILDKLQLIITVHQHHFSRLAIYQCLKQEWL